MIKGNEMLCFGRPIVATVKFDFCYGHFLRKYDGKCSNFHGHNAVLEVSVTGMCGGFSAPNCDHPDMVVDFNILKSYIKEHVIEVFDHKCLNYFHEYKDTSPTAEKMLTLILNILNKKGSPFSGKIKKVRLSETPNSWVEWES